MTVEDNRAAALARRTAKDSLVDFDGPKRFEQAVLEGNLAVELNAAYKHAQDTLDTNFGEIYFKPTIVV